MNKPEYNLTNSDIGGAQPNCVKFTTNRKGHNPLNPTYKVSEVEKRPYTPPRYMRDGMDIEDIEGARPKQVKQDKIKTREVNKIDDIEGTKANLRHAPR